MADADAAGSNAEACANPDDSASAFFIDTASRADKSPYWKTNQVTGGIKALLLLMTLLLVQWVLYRKQGGKAADGWRKRLVMACSVVFVTRVVFQMFVFWHRRILWTEVLAEAGIIIPVSLGSLAIGSVRRGRRVPKMMGMDWLGVALFCWGTYLNFASELQRHVWKQDPSNVGRLYTLHLWQHSRHINYFGEIVSFVGLVFLCELWNLWIPLLQGIGLAFFSVPELDFYLAKRYPADWELYTQHVPWNMIPFIW